MIIKKAVFIKSASKVEQCPEADLPEIAVIGRSNVGKSSLINMLAGNNTLAKASRTPGKTKLINYFLMNDLWYLVDLPGYGYAKSSRDDRADWMDMIQEHFTKRPRLKRVLVLIDGKLPPQNIDLNFIETLHEENVPFDIIVTKIDKASQSDLHKNLTLFTREVQKFCPQLPIIIQTSSLKERGKLQLLDYLEKLLSA